MEQHLLKIISKFAKQKILVIGDFMLDVYIKGDGRRLSPEAPVPVVDVLSTKRMPGGAANAAANLKAMGAEVLFCTVTSEDRTGRYTKTLLDNYGIDTRYLVAEPRRKTLIKTRVMAGEHAVVRFDRGDCDQISGETEQRLIDLIKNAYRDCQAVLIADYNKGIITKGVLDTLKKLQETEPKIMAIDSKRLAFFRELKPAFVKPNYAEALQLIGQKPGRINRKSELSGHGDSLFQKTQASVVAVTLDEDGAVWFKDGKLIHESLAVPVAHPKVCGAGDTYISACLLALLAPASYADAADMAAAAASIAVQKEFTAICGREELIEKVNPGEKIMVSHQLLQARCQHYKSSGKRIVFTNGCFDILHSGHVNYLRQAKELGDILIVGLNTDESIRRLKGPQRPINPFEDRVAVLGALGCVDHIVPFGSVKDQDMPIQLIRLIAPQLFAKGGDYQKEQLPEATVVERLGGEVRFIPLTVGRSTTKLINAIHEHKQLERAI